MALTSVLSSVPYLTEKNLTNVRAMMSVLVVSNITAILGGVAGFWLTNSFPRGEAYFTIALGMLLFFVFTIMVTCKQVEFPVYQNTSQ